MPITCLILAVGEAVGVLVGAVVVDVDVCCWDAAELALFGDDGLVVDVPALAGLAVANGVVGVTEGLEGLVGVGLNFEFFLGEGGADVDLDLVDGDLGMGFLDLVKSFAADFLDGAPPTGMDGTDQA